MKSVSRNNRRIGGSYEQIAADYLVSRGVLLLERNFRCRQGEIDLIGLDGRYLVFVEVKYRADSRKGYPAEAVHYYKQNKIRQVAVYYLFCHGYPEDTACRFDVISIMGNEIKWFRNSFS